MEDVQVAYEHNNLKNIYIYEWGRYSRNIKFTQTVDATAVSIGENLLGKNVWQLMKEAEYDMKN